MISIRSLRLSLRFILPLVIALTLLAYAVVPLVDKLTLRWAVRDMDIRSRLIANTLHDPLAELLQQGNKAKINALLLRAIQDERLLALGFCDGSGKLLYRTPTFPKSLGCSSTTSMISPLHKLPKGAVHVATHPMEFEGVQSGSLILVHDMSFVERRSADTRRYIIMLFAVLGVIISVITVFVAHLSWRGWMDGVRAMLRGEGILKPFSQPAVPSELQPLVGDLRTLLRTLDEGRRFADDATVTWSPDSLRKLLHKQLAGERIIVVSNREPYIHTRKEERIEVHRPASGLVTAVEPVMRACS
ncbi:MAG: trehalose-6-phosphate synthase, partial [Geobacteraceae bacterium]